MIIKNKKFILRHPKISDLNAYHKNINDATIGKNIRNVSYPYPIEKSKNFLINSIKDNKSRKKTRELFIIDIGGECAGGISLSAIEQKHKAMVGYWISKDNRGKGITTECLKLITKYGFKKYGLRRIYATTVTFNHSSARVLEKCGYKLEGTLKKNRLKKGKYYDDYIYAITR